MTVTTITRRCSSNACQQGRKPCPTPMACADRAHRQPEAAHAASEEQGDEPTDTRPIPGAGLVVWLLAAPAVVALIACAAVFWPR